jgi:ABC-type tungstate transport system permease subunit
MPLNSFEPFLAFGGKIDPLTEIRNAGLVTSGRVLWVKATTDADYNTVKDAVGASFMFNNIQKAVDACRSDKNDYILVAPKDGGTAFRPNEDVAGTALLLNKARVHLLSLGFNRTPYGYETTLQGHGTTSAYDTSLVKVLAPGVEIGGFRILGTAGTTANGTTNTYLLAGTASTGTAHNLWVHDCAIETNLAASGGANGTPTMVSMTNDTGPDGIRFDNCLIGNTAAGPVKWLSLNNIGKHHNFNDNTFVGFTGNSADIFISPGTGATNYALFKRNVFINQDSATAVASLFVGSTTVKNPVLMVDCQYVNFTQAGTDPTIFKTPVASGTAASVRDYGIAVGTAALTPV